MVTTIDAAFTAQFESEVHMDFQRMGSTIRNTVRTKNGITGLTTTFQRAGKGVAGAKDRHGNVPIMNANRTAKTATLSDRYAGEYIDKLDELKIQHDERSVASQTLAGAMGRDVDDILFETMDGGSNANNSWVATTWSAASSAIAFMEFMGKADVPFDGNLFAAVSWPCWGDLLDIDEFSNQDYTPGDKLWFDGVTSKFWLGFNWFPHNGLPLDSSGDAKQFFWHRSSVGHAIGQDYKLDMSWVGEKQATLAVGSMSHGAVNIDDTGIIEMVYDITP